MTTSRAPSAPLPPKLARLIPRLATSHEGEALATVRAIGRTLSTAGLDFHDLARAVEASTIAVSQPVLEEPERGPDETDPRAVARFLLDARVARANRTGLPLGTVVVNVTGSFLLGLLTGWLLTGVAGEVGAVLGTGFLGGYTTFSTAAVEAARLVRAGRGWAALVHAGGMLVAGLAAAVLGLWLLGPR